MDSNRQALSTFPLSTVKERAYRARKERAAEAEEKARNEVHKNEVPLFD